MITKTPQGLSPLLFLLLITLSCSQLVGDIKIPDFFKDHMVLQREMDVPIWGWADAGEEVEVSFSGSTYKAVADSDGKWMLKMGPMPANSTGQDLVIGEHTIKDVLIGEVWLCSGQSNMDWLLKEALNAKEEIEAANYPLIRYLKVDSVCSYLPKTNVDGTWSICSPETANRYSAVGYFFGRKLHKELNIPIGLISASWGGTGVDPWIPAQAYGIVAPEVEKNRNLVYSGLPISPEGKAKWDAYLKHMETWLPGAKKKVAAGELPVNRPQRPSQLVESHHGHTKIFNARINPLIPYAFRGVIWYQGESNGGEGISYFYKKKALIQGWRGLWGQGDFPFYLVQLANLREVNPKPEGGDGYATIREAQRKCLELKNTGMAVTIDIGEAKNIHPKNKQDVGLRLAYWALAKNYGRKDLVYSGPLYDHMEIKDKEIEIHFSSTGSGLMTGLKKGIEPTQPLTVPPKGFSICGADKQWHWADAKISKDGKRVMLSSPNVSSPVAARYAYRWNPKDANLYNKEGLPASPFRTDDGGEK